MPVNNNLSCGEQFAFSQEEQRTPLLTDSSLWGEGFSFNDAVTSQSLCCVQCYPVLKAQEDLLIPQLVPGYLGSVLHPAHNQTNHIWLHVSFVLIRDIKQTNKQKNQFFFFLKRACIMSFGSLSIITTKVAMGNLNQQPLKVNRKTPHYPLAKFE